VGRQVAVWFDIQKVFWGTDTQFEANVVTPGEQAMQEYFYLLHFEDNGEVEFTGEDIQK